MLNINNVNNFSGSTEENKTQKSGSFVDVRLGGKEYRVRVEVYEKLANGELQKVPQGSALSKKVSAVAKKKRDSNEIAKIVFV